MQVLCLKNWKLSSENLIEEYNNVVIVLAMNTQI